MPRRSCLTIADKLKIIEYAELNKSSLRTLAGIFKVGKSHVGEILKRKVEICEAARCGAKLKSRKCGVRKKLITEEEGEIARTQKLLILVGERRATGQKGFSTKFVLCCCYEMHAAPRKRAPLDEGLLKMATNDVILGKGLRWTADYYGINHTTLYYRVQAEKKRREAFGENNRRKKTFFFLPISVLDSMPLQQRLATLQTPKIEIPSPSEPVLKSQPLSPTKLKVTRQSQSLFTPKKQEPAPPPPPPPQPQQQQPVEEEVCLRWNSHHSNMQTSFPDLLQKEQYVDVTLASEGKMLKCHRVREREMCRIFGHLYIFLY